MTHNSSHKYTTRTRFVTTSVHVCNVNVQNIFDIFKTIWTSPKYYATSKRMPLKTHLAQWPRVILNSNLSFLQIKLHTKNQTKSIKKILETLIPCCFQNDKKNLVWRFQEKKRLRAVHKLSENFKMIKLGKVIRL